MKGDIAFKPRDLEPTNIPYNSYLEIQNAVLHLSKGFNTRKQGYYFISASQILGFSVLRSVIPGMFSSMGKLFSYGTTHVPDSVKYTLSKWSDISKFAINGGKPQLFLDDSSNDMYKTVSIVKAVKFNKKNPMPKIKASTYKGPRNFNTPRNFSTSAAGFPLSQPPAFSMFGGRAEGFPFSQPPAFSMFGGRIKITGGTVQSWLWLPRLLKRS